MPLSLLPVQGVQDTNNRQILTELQLLKKSGAFGAAPTSPYTGQLWYDTTAIQLKIWNGTTWVVLSTGGTVTSITAGTGLTGGAITTSGTIALSVPVSIANGGTNAITASAARTNLGSTTVGDAVFVAATAAAARTAIGAVIGTDVQAYNANTAFRTDKLSAFAATTSAELAGVISNETGSGALVFGTSPAITTPTGIVKGDVGLGSVDNTADAAKAVLSATKWTTARNLAGNSTDGSANVTFANKFIVQGTTDTGLSAAQFLGSLSTGILKNTTTTGVLSIATASDLPTGIDHHTLTNFTANDDHTQYALLAGRSGGQTLKGGTAASENLTLNSTAHATKGFILSSDSIGVSSVTTVPSSKQVAVSTNTASPTHSATGKGYLAVDTTAVGFYVKETSTTVEGKYEAVTSPASGVGFGTISNHPVGFYSNNNLRWSLLAGGGMTGDSLTLSTALPVLSGGTGVTTSTGTTNVVLSGSPTIVTPTIASFTNATHDHSNAAGGGTLTHTALPNGVCVQEVAATFTASAVGTTTTPIDDTIPQITEGTEFMTAAITPKSTTNRLVIEWTYAYGHATAGVFVTSALHQDSTANALAAISQYQAAAGAFDTVAGRHEMAAGTTSSTTFRIRIGANAAGNLTFNGTASTRLFGAITKSTLVIREYKA